MRSLLYVGHYDTAENISDQRQYAPSAVNKMGYICSAINRAGWKVQIASPCVTIGKRPCRGKEVQVSEHTKLRLFYSLGTRSKAERVLRIIFVYFQLFFYLLFNTKRNEPVLVYHSLAYAGLIRFLRRIKGFHLVLEVEEIYADVTGREQDRKKEFQLFRYADAFLFPTEFLNDVINRANKPYAIVYGTYQVEPDREMDKNEENEERVIHCVYAGTLDPRKGSATAAAAAAYLPSNYHIHILGFGTEQDKLALQDCIAAANLHGHARVTYDGILSGEEFIRFLQSCDIGLSTQRPDAAFNETSFPSKVLTYLANGLQVVSIRIKALERASIGNLLYYYDEDSPEMVASAIKEIDPDCSNDSRVMIRQLDSCFVNAVASLLNEA